MTPGMCALLTELKAKPHVDVPRGIRFNGRRNSMAALERRGLAKSEGHVGSNTGAFGTAERFTITDKGRQI